MRRYRFILGARLVLLCLALAALLVSYRALMLDHEPLHPGVELDQMWQDMQRWPYRISLWWHLFTLSYMIMLVNLRLPFLHTLLFFMFSCVLIVAAQWTVSSSGLQLALIAVVGSLAPHRAWNSEKQDQQRFIMEQSLEEAKQRIENLLDALMPPHVVQELKNSPDKLPSHQYHLSTVFQSDLNGFTQLASTRRPEEVVELLGDLFGLYDELADKYEIWKVETVGDAYIAAQAGLPLTEKHCPLSVLRFAIEVIKTTDSWSTRRGFAVRCRVGMHTGECTGGIVGLEMQRYHLFGELMEVVDVLESTGGVGKVHLSNSCQLACRKAIELQLSHEPQKDLHFDFEATCLPHLLTSKGDIVDYSQAAGKPTYMLAVTPDQDEEAEMSTYL